MEDSSINTFKGAGIVASVGLGGVAAHFLTGGSSTVTALISTLIASGGSFVAFKGQKTLYKKSGCLYYHYEVPKELHGKYIFQVQKCRNGNFDLYMSTATGGTH